MQVARNISKQLCSKLIDSGVLSSLSPVLQESAYALSVTQKAEQLSWEPSTWQGAALLSRSWSSKPKSVHQDLGPANPVPEEVSEARVANSITHKLVEAGERGDLAGVLKVVESAGEEFDESAVEAALLQIEWCTKDMSEQELTDKVHNNRSFQMLADMAVSSAGNSPPEVIARTIGVLGRLRFSDQMVIDELARGLMPNIQQLDPPQLQQLVDGLKEADHSPGVLLLDAVHERLQGLGQEVQQQQADSIRRNLRELGHDSRSTAHPPGPERQSEGETQYT